MTIKQLMESVAALGFEEEIVERDLFFSAATQALSIIYTDCEITRTVRVSRESQEVLTYIPKYRHTGGTVSLPLCGAAYSFTSSGTGKCTVKDGYEEYTFELSGNMTEHRGFLESGGEIVFSGDYSYTVYNLTCFGTRAGDRLSDIPIYDGVGYIDVAGMFGDFLSFVSLPTDSDG